MISSPIAKLFPEDETGSWSTENSYQYCERIARDHYENFPVASFFLPRSLKKHVATIYAFARTADDFADEPGLSDEERLQRLNEWEVFLTEAAKGQANHPIFIALGDTISRFEIPVTLLHNLLTAFRSDVTIHRYPTFKDLLGYCENSANPIGRLLLLLFKYRDDQLMMLSDKICTALQLTNFWQDVAVDLDKGRIYIPQEDFTKFGYSEKPLFERKMDDTFRSVLAFEVERTERLFDEGKTLFDRVGNDLKIELRLTWLGGVKILEKIKKKNYDVLTERPLLSKFDKLLLFGSAFSKR